MSKAIYQHYRPQEYAFIDQVLGWCLQVQDRYTPFVTAFLTPREQTITQQLVSRYDDLSVGFFGGHKTAERQKAIIYPEYFEPKESDYHLALVEIEYPRKFNTLSHPQVLGTLMSLGIERERLGDIITNGADWQFFIDETLVDYVKQQIDKIGQMGVKLNQLSSSKVLTPNIYWIEETAIVTSLRIDALISSVYNFSRQQAKTLIERGDVKLNFMTIERINEEVALNDMISVRRQGRFKVQSLEGVTRKDNLRVSILKLCKGIIHM